MTPDDSTLPEVAAHALLELAATHPGQVGRLRASRIVGGFAVPTDDERLAEVVARHSTAVSGWTLRDLVALVDALLAGGLLAQTSGQRPTLVLTRAGHRALDALDQTSAMPACASGGTA